jgi:class 3 adenylate cyclase
VQGNCAIGRASHNQVVLQDEKVSRRHAVIHAQSLGEYWLVDLGSSNGTSINGRRVSQPCRLNDHDRIEIGSHVLSFRQHRTEKGSNADRATEKTIQDIRSIECWLLVADLADSTRTLKELAPDEAARFTGRWLATCKQVVEDHHGVINKFLGDGFFAYWKERPEAAAEVVRAGRSLHGLQQAKGSPRFRLVLHYGKVFVGGEASLGEESLMGAEVNFVFRMEKLAAGLGIHAMVSDVAANRLQPALPTQALGAHPLPGFEGEFLFHSF